MDITLSQTPDPVVDQIIDTGLEAHGRTMLAQTAPLMPLQIYCRHEGGRILGGLQGNTGNGWLHIWQIWVHEDRRNQSIGSQLLAAAEAEAIQRHCTHAHLETLSVQGLRFFLKSGYEDFGRLPNYVGPYAQHFLRKALAGGGPATPADPA